MENIVVGIMYSRNIDPDIMGDLMTNAIDLTYESWALNRTAELKEEGLTEEEIEEAIYEESDICDFDSPTFLIGDWKIDTEGKYTFDKTGSNGFSATCCEGIVSVEWSNTTKRCHHTSPCYQMVSGGPCGDLDTEGDSVTAFTVPSEFLIDSDDK